MGDINEKIKEQITNNNIVLYMKGSPTFPQCGFSGRAAELLKRCGAKGYFSVDILQDSEMREGIKQFSNWPTIPQLYVKGEFVGGSDIMMEMFESGELKKLIDTAL
ncbi:MAG: Grx4 family monothiol glutaredoxin [Magnetococcales bacterium]|nr:Grx4 family monothiol glutaredoxin [Magnetococcales bacterium]